MFKDYYEILGIAPSSTFDEIKAAYKTETLKWHPDRNHNIDVTIRMQDINEAYAILKDHDKKYKYDIEYTHFKKVIFQRDISIKPEDFDTPTDINNYSYTYYYNVQDESLKDDIQEAREFAKKIVEDFLKEVKETSHRAIKGAEESALKYAIGWVLSGVLLLFICKACS